MGLFSRFERGMESGIEGAADKVFDAPISPVQISKKAEKAMKREKMVGSGRQYAPTLYTVLVNPDDDRRLFGYYPTLAGETETYLAAKADEEGLAMDGQPLVRFIVDDELKHGKFDVIAEMVSAPIIAQLRQEEMERYGLAGNAQSGRAGQAQQRPAVQAPKPQQNFRRGQGNYSAYDQQEYAQPRQQPANPYANGYAQQQPARNARREPAQQPYAAPRQRAPRPQQQRQPQAAAPASGYAPQPQAAYPAAQPRPQQAPAPRQARPQAQPAPAPQPKQPLPYVPESEIDRSIDYGEYTFNSQDFDDYGSSRAPKQARPQRQQAPARPQASAFEGMPPVPGAGAPAADSYAQQSAQAGAQPLIPAQLVDAKTGRSYALVSPRMILGRSSASDLVVDDINASRSHAELRFESQGVWVITDLGSTNGTYVNGQRITTHALSEGDRISVGMTELVFTLG